MVAELAELGQVRAARIVSRMPATGGILDEEYVNGVLFRSHAELQRLSEEFLQPQRVLALLRPTVAAYRAHATRTPIRVVDFGCGLGYLIRWLAAKGDLGPDVELIGVDFNDSLVNAASAAAKAESLKCRFVTGDVFALDEPATIVTSVGVLHHFAAQSLESLFRAHETAGVAAFMHYDIAPTWPAPLGAWLFHAARMREPLARQDGVLSAVRAHDDETLTSAARAGTSSYRIGVFGTPFALFPVTRIIRPVVGIRPELVDQLRRGLGRMHRHLNLE